MRARPEPDYVERICSVRITTIMESLYLIVAITVQAHYTTYFELDGGQ